MAHRTGRLLVFPYYDSNPYLNVLNLAARGAGWEVPTGNTTYADLRAEVPRLTRGDVLHIHWTAPVLSKLEDEAAALTRAEEFDAVLAAVADRGVTILWTVHNDLPHDAQFMSAEIRVAESLIAHATRIVQLHDLTRNSVSYDLPADKLVTVPHSSFLGVYPDTTDAAARARIGVPEGVPTVGFVGLVRPYKGIDVLGPAIDLVTEQLPDLHFVLAGMIRPWEAVRVEQALPKKAPVVRSGGFVSDTDLSTWFRASDIIALPFRRILNSGSLLAAITFDRTCVIPDNTPLSSVYAAHACVRPYATGGDEVAALAGAIVDAFDHRGEGALAAHSLARALTPYDMSRTYLDLLDRVALGATAR